MHRPLSAQGVGPLKLKEHDVKAHKKPWVHNVKTVSTFPPEGTFTKNAQSIARIMASKKVSPKGIGSGIRMIQYFINRAGKGLATFRKKELQKAIAILREKSARHRDLTV